MPKPRVVARAVGILERPAGRTRGATWSVHACDMLNPRNAQRVASFARLELRHHGPAPSGGHPRPLTIRANEIRHLVAILTVAADAIAPELPLVDGAGI